MYKNMNRGKKQKKILLRHTKLTHKLAFRNINLKVEASD